MTTTQDTNGTATRLQHANAIGLLVRLYFTTKLENDREAIRNAVSMWCELRGYEMVVDNDYGIRVFRTNGTQILCS